MDMCAPDSAPSSSIRARDSEPIISSGTRKTRGARVAVTEAPIAKRTSEYRGCGRGSNPNSKQGRRRIRSSFFECSICGALVEHMAAINAARKEGRNLIHAKDGCASRLCSSNYRNVQRFACRQKKWAQFLVDKSAHLIASLNGASVMQKVTVLSWPCTLKTAQRILSVWACDSASTSLCANMARVRAPRKLVSIRRACYNSAHRVCTDRHESTHCCAGVGDSSNDRSQGHTKDMVMKRVWAKRHLDGDSSK